MGFEGFPWVSTCLYGLLGLSMSFVVFLWVSTYFYRILWVSKGFLGVSVGFYRLLCTFNKPLKKTLSMHFNWFLEAIGVSMGTCGLLWVSMGIFIGF